MIPQDCVNSLFGFEFSQRGNAGLDPFGRIDQVACHKDKIGMEAGEAVEKPPDEKSFFGEVEVGEMKDGEGLTHRF